MMSLILVAALLVVPGPEALLVAPPTGSADLILHGGRVLTMLEPEPLTASTALACRDGRIIWVGDDQSTLALKGEHTEVHDLQGAVAIPGLVDSHAHLYGLGQSLAQIKLAGTANVEDCLDRVMSAAGETPTGWLQGRGWDQNDWPVIAWPTKEQLDQAVPGRPVMLRRIDGHAAWVSSEALRLAGITAQTADPDGGAILRDAHGEPTGILVDNAVDLIRAVIPAPDAAEIRRRVDLAVDHCLSLGLVGVHEAGTPWSRVELYRSMHENHELPLRLSCMLDDQPATLEAGFAAGPFVTGDHLLQVRAVKLYADGALGSRGALLLDDYSDRPGLRGLQVTTTAHLEDVCRRAAAGGFQVGTHAIGDGANRLMLDIYEKVLGPDLAEARWRIEHAQILTASDLVRFGDLGVIAAMQPTHCTSDMDWADERLGEERLTGAYAWRSLLDTGAVLCFGTDFPIEKVEPLDGLFSARTRQHADLSPAGGWQSQECLDGRTALRLYTLGSAHAAFLEDETGVLAPGRLADVTVLTGDPTTGNPALLLEMKAVMTVVHGEVRWRGEVE